MLKNRYKNLKKYKSYFKKQKKNIIILILVMISASSLGMALPYFYSKRLVGVTDINFNISLKYSLIIIGIIILHHTSWYYWEKLGSKLSNKLAENIREDILENVINTKYMKIKNKSTGYYLERLNDDVSQVASFLPNILGTLVDCLTNFSFLVLIFILNYKCGMLFFIGIVLLFIIDSVKIKKDLKYTEENKILVEKFDSKIIENIKNIKDIKVLGIKNEIKNNILNISKNISINQFKKDSQIAFYSRIKTFLQYVIECGIIVYCVGVLIPNGEISLVSLLLIINYSGFMYELVSYITIAKDNLEKSEYKAGRILEILNNSNLEKFGEIQQLNNYEIAINNLSFKYENVSILDNINLKIKENTLNLFIGHSGAGKSTLFGLMTKILECSDSKIFIGNKDINSMSEKCLRDNICVINQNPFIINDTILNNIKLVKQNASDEEVIEICRSINIWDEINNFENGFNTVISENGNNLSGGQIQRIAIARALLKNTPVILFDEPTSALDQVNQKIFFDLLMELKGKKTILVISHKYENIDSFDNVYQLKNGNLDNLK